MSIIKILPEHKSNTTIQFSPRRVFSSGSGGLTGSINVIVNRSSTQKDNVDMREGLTNEEGPQKFTENTFEGRRRMIYDATFNTVGQGNIFSESPPAYNYDLQLGLLLDGAADDLDKDGFGETYNPPPELLKEQYRQLNLNFAHIGYSDLPMHPRNAYQLHISRSVPGTDIINKEYRKKEIIRNILDRSQAVARPGYGWGYGNYNCVNFFETNQTEVPAIVYRLGADTNYNLTNNLQIDFRIKVNRYPTSAGTILHLPGAYAVSVVTGSTTDESNRPKYYKLLLQLGTDASGSVLPSTVDLSVANEDRGNTQIYQSLPNLTASMWHDCSIRFSKTHNQGTGSFIIDGSRSGTFLPTGSFSLGQYFQSAQNPLLSLGAFYYGTAYNAKTFFNTTGSANQGIVAHTGVLLVNGHPSGSFTSPLNAEVHEVKISDNYRSLKDIRANLGTATTSSSDLSFHLPVLYSSDSPVNYYNAMIGDLFDAGGSMTSSPTLAEFYENFPVPVQKSFDSPFNTHHSNIGGFPNINVQSFLRDFVSENYPYIHQASSSVRSFSSCHEMSSSWHLFDSHQRRNTMILPSDDGGFTRSYDVYPASQLTGSVVDSTRPEIIRLTNLGDFTNNYDSKLVLVDEGWKYSESSALESQHGAGPRLTSRGNQRPQSKFQGGADTGTGVTIPTQRFFNPSQYGIVMDAERSSNLISMFSIPTLFYGNRLRPGTVKMYSDLYCGGGAISQIGTDNNGDPIMGFVKGNDYRMRVSLQDDGYGNLIRSDTSGSLALSNFVGSVYYEDGIIALKSPHLFNFGEHNFTLDFEGEQNTHILELLVPVTRNMFNSSSNPNYNAYKPLSDVNEEADSFIYLSTLNFHDSNLNVVAKVRMAQPVIKRINDKYLFRVKFDF